MKLLYCSYSQIPSDTANSIAVMKQCAALYKRCNLKIILIRGKQKTDYRKKYHVPEMKMTLLPLQVLERNELGLRCFSVLKALIWRPDMVYSRDLFLNVSFCHRHIPNFYEIHQLDQQDEEFDYKYKEALKIIAKSPYLKKIVCISEKLRQECLEFGIEDEKLIVLHSGVDLSEYYESSSLSMPKLYFSKNQPLAVYAGSLQEGKGVDIILKMASAASHYNFLIIGGEKGQIQECDNLKHIPWIEHFEVSRYLQFADFLLMPMTVQKYQFHSPLKLFEYLATGKVVIASDLENIKEILVHGVNGMLAEPQNAKSFIEQMDKVRMDKELRILIEENAKKTVEQFSWEKRGQHLLEYIKKEVYIR